MLTLFPRDDTTDRAGAVPRSPHRRPQGAPRRHGQGQVRRLRRRGESHVDIRSDPPHPSPATFPLISDDQTPASARSRGTVGRAIFPPLAPRLTRSRPSSFQSDDTLVKVRTIISEQLGTDLDAVAADAKFVDLGADSLDTVEIMMALEEEFEITLDEEGAEKIATVQEAADMIQEQMA